MRAGWRTFRGVVGYYPRVLKLVWEASPRYTLVALLLNIASGAVQPAHIWISKVLIDRITGALEARTLGIDVNWMTLLTPVALIFLVWVLGTISQSIGESVMDMLAQVVESRAEYLVLEKASHLDMAFFETPAFYDQMANARRELWRASNLVYLGINTVGLFLSFGATLALLLRLHPLAVVVLLVTAAPHFLLQARYSSQLFRFWTSRTPAQRMVYYLTELLSSRDAAKEIRLFGLHTPFLERHRRFWGELARDLARIRFSREKLNVVLAILSMLGTVAVWAVAVMQAALARITIGDVALVFQAVEVVRDRLRQLFWTLGSFYEASLFLGNYFSFLDLAPDSVSGALARDGQTGGTGLTVPKPLRQGIEFRGVSFHYPQADRLVLHDISFVIRPGERVAVVGENGAGKTTLVKLLTRLYDPTAGQILLDGRDLREYDLDDLRRQIGVIFQDFLRYDLSARENIGFGRVEYVEDGERVARAAESGGSRAIVERLPQRFETILGRTFEGGVDLSGGEWQKLALSRAFMREAQIMILDEPTAALDALAEYEVYQRFADLTSGKTTIFISHRFSTVRTAQHVLVFHEGRLIEEGSHDELMASDGQYAKMFNIQASQYR
ncbi:MAG TPA: ABC transporter ATP-binding protein [Ardenticatenaceae bacterium]|nr:ABC transporter ATP-binding protein [Ardenticatenaceae bacterium]